MYTELKTEFHIPPQHMWPNVSATLRTSKIGVAASFSLYETGHLVFLFDFGSNKRCPSAPQKMKSPGSVLFYFPFISSLFVRGGS